MAPCGPRQPRQQLQPLCPRQQPQEGLSWGICKGEEMTDFTGEERELARYKKVLIACAMMEEEYEQRV